MRPSAEQDNLEWAKRMIRPLVREFPHFRADIESEALLGLVRAERHPSCPGAGQFQRFAYSFVKRAVTDFTRQLRRQRRSYFPLDDADLIGDHSPTPSLSEWKESRLNYAEHLPGLPKTVFLAAYGEESHRTLKSLEQELSVPIYKIKRAHGAAMEALRGLPSFQQVA